MIRSGLGHFVEITQSKVHLSLHRGFLKVNQEGSCLGKIPLDDILGIVITGHGCTHSSNVLVALSDRGIPVSICGSNFSPKVFVLPLIGNCRQNARIQLQVNMSKPLKKQLWKKVIKCKLKNQALLLNEFQIPVYKNLIEMSKRVKSGDMSNLEAQGARLYWLNLFSKGFKRDKDGDGINAVLNYAYAIIRSCVARSIVATGFHPSIGIHHHNAYNPMCLVDDLMEPFRPIADYVVKQLHSKGCYEVNTDTKRILSKIAVANVIQTESGLSSLFQGVNQVCVSLASVLSKEYLDWDVDFKINWKNCNIDFLKLENIQAPA